MAEIKELAKQLGANQEEAFKANKTILDMVTRATAPGKESERQSLAEALVKELTAKSSEEKKKNEYVLSEKVRTKLTRLLSFVAGEKEIPALAESLRDLDVREMARFALDFNTSDAATEVLIKALDDVGPEYRIGVVGALGRRRGDAALKVLQDVAANDTDPQVQVAAVEELGRFADVKNDAIIAAAANGHYKNNAIAARLRLAETLRDAGLRPEARRIYKAIQSSDADDYQKKAAQFGLDAIG